MTEDSNILYYKIGGKWAVSWWSGFCFFSSWISRWELPNYTSYILLSPIFHSSCLFQLSSLSRPSAVCWPSDFFSAKENKKVARHYKTFKIIGKKIKNHWLQHVFILLRPRRHYSWRFPYLSLPRSKWRIPYSSSGHFYSTRRLFIRENLHVCRFYFLPGWKDVIIFSL